MHELYVGKAMTIQNWIWEVTYFYLNQKPLQCPTSFVSIHIQWRILVWHYETGRHLDNWHECLIPAPDEECVQQGIEFVPARLKQKKPKDSGGEVKRGRAPKHAESSWEPSTSDEDHSDSEDSMSDLYPRQYPKCTHCRHLCPVILWLICQTVCHGGPRVCRISFEANPSDFAV